MSDVDAEPPKGKESEYGCSHYKRRCAFIVRIPLTHLLF